MTASKRLITTLATISVVAACTAPTSSTSSPEITTAPPTIAEEDFDSFVEESFRTIVERQPELVTELGLDKAYGTRPARLDDLSPAYLDETAGVIARTLAGLEAYSFAELSDDQQLTYLSYQWHLEQMVDAHRYRLHDWPVHFLLNSYNQGVILLLTLIHPLNSSSDADDFLKRLEALPEQVDQVVSWMEDSEIAGVLPPRYVVEITIQQLRGDIAAGDAASTELLRSFETRLSQSGLSPDDLDDHVERAGEAIEAHFIPSWRNLIEHLEGLLDSTDDSVSLSRLPDGDGYYAHLLALHTSTELTAVEIHQMGQTEAERIKDEMRALATAAGLPATDINAIRAAFADLGGLVEGDAIVSTYEELIEDAEERFSPYFDLIPDIPLEVRVDDGPTAFYVGPAVDGSRPGVFYAATGRGAVRGHTMASLAYHEAIPGHHFQISLAQELDIPSPRRYLTSTGHVEGWALYAERLAEEIGVYEGNPAGSFGRLDFELLRAARLVVDTGIHHLGWSRSEALEQMTEIMEGDHFNHEVDRYVLYPAQATAYLVGMNEILRLRDLAGAVVTDLDSMARFHRAVIGQGNIPLGVLGETIPTAAG